MIFDVKVWFSLISHSQISMNNGRALYQYPLSSFIEYKRMTLVYLTLLVNSNGCWISNVINAIIFFLINLSNLNEKKIVFTSLSISILTDPLFFFPSIALVGHFYREAFDGTTESSSRLCRLQHASTTVKFYSYHWFLCYSFHEILYI